MKCNDRFFIAIGHAELKEMQDFTERNQLKWSKADYWKKICPSLSIGLEHQATTSSTFSLQEGQAQHQSPPDVDTDHEERKQQLRKRGFAVVNDRLDATLIESLRQGIEQLHRLGFPACFVLLYDATWLLAARSRDDVLTGATAIRNQFHHDILAWRIDDKGGAAGFSPHRDRQPNDNDNDNDVAASFHPNGDAKFVTHWIALSDATPANSCLYMIPADMDPGYKTGDCNNEKEEEDPLRRALPDKTAYQHIRAIPRKSGESILFTHRVLHWGSAREPYDNSPPPRIAISFVCADPDFEKPYVDPLYFSSSLNDDSNNNNKLPPFRIRLLLVCAQLLSYYQRFDLPVTCLKACYKFCKENEDELEESYRRKVNVEFVKAMKEIQDRDADDDSDNEEAVMEAMLENEMEFSDDYDELNGNNEAAAAAAAVRDEDGISDEDLDDYDKNEPVFLFGKREATPTNEDGRKRAKTHAET